MKDFLFFIMVVLLLCIAVSTPVVGLGMWFDYMNCHQRWEGSGFDSRWKTFGGCQIRKGDEPWLPEGMIIRTEP